jgi:glycosyltransferase involved in cell wall biosynthesis
MIVRDEATVIRRCLDSVKGSIVAWAIVDTGSTDGTQDIIRETLKGTPGELVERPWVDYSTNRNQAIELAIGKASHAFVIDADDTAVVRGKLPLLTQDAYRVIVHHGANEHARIHVFRPECTQYRYQKVRHEFINANCEPILQEMTIKVVGGGARSKDPQKYVNDAIALETELKTDPDPRNVFYLAQSWQDAGSEEPNRQIQVGHFEKACRWYEERVRMGGGYVGEIFISLYRLANLYNNLGRDTETVVNAFLRAWEYHPHRAEPLVELACYLRQQEPPRYEFAALVADWARKLPKPDGLFVTSDHYDWRALHEFTIAANYVPGRRQAAIEAGFRILQSNAPESEKEQARKNIGYSQDKLKKDGR